MTDFLKEMAQSSRHRAESARTSRSYTDTDFDKPVIPLSLSDFDVIAEIKDRSPAEGELASKDRDCAAQAVRYQAGGAAAISVLTEPSRFSGTLHHLEEVVAAAPDTPVMRKDFLVDPVQILEARAVGASGVLLIVAMLSDKELREMLDCAGEYDLFVLLESFDEDDLTRTSELLNAADLAQIERAQLLFGVNTRNLRTLEVDSGRLGNLGPVIPDGHHVAESGLHTAEDAARVAALGYSIALVGTALMKSADPAKLIRNMRDAGRAVIAP